MKDLRISPTGGLITRGGGLVTPGGGLLAPAPVSSAPSYTIDTITPAEIATITGISAPTLMWRGGDASGATELVAGTDNFSDRGSPTHEVDDTALGGLTTEFTDGAVAVSCWAATTAVADATTNAFAFIWIGRFTDIVGVQTVFGKRDAGGDQNGYELLRNNDGLYWIVDTPLGSQLRSLTAAHGTDNAQTILCTRKATANEANVYSREGSSTGSRYADTVATTTNPLAVGFCRVAAAGQRWGALLYYEGATAESIDDSHRLLIAEALGYE